MFRVTEKSLLESLNDKDLFCQQISLLTEDIIDHFYTNWEFRLNKEDLVQDAVICMVEKADKFNSTKGKAINFFAKCIMGYLMQFRKRKNEKKMG